MVNNFRPPRFLAAHIHPSTIQEAPFGNREHPGPKPPVPRLVSLPQDDVLPPALEDAPTLVTAPPAVEEPLRPPPPTPPAPPPSPPPGAESPQTRAMERLSNALQALRLESAALTEAARADALEVGFQVARKILEQAVTADVSALLALVKSALRRIGEARSLRVRVNPVDLPGLQVAIHEGGHHELTLARLELVEDPSLSRGDVMVEGEMGAVDGRLETRLEEVRAALAGGLQGE